VARSAIALAAALALVAHLAWPSAVHTQTPTLVAVLHQQNTAQQIGRTELRNMALGTTTFWSDNSPITLYVRPPSTPAGRELFRVVLQMTPTRYRQHWMSRQLSGQGVAPAVVESTADLVRRVARNTGAIGVATSEELQGATLTGVRSVPIR
jgi:hypothetical protein